MSYPSAAALRARLKGQRVEATDGAVADALAAAISAWESIVRWRPFLAAIGRTLVWSVLPNGRKATFYDLWSGHRSRPARFRRHLEEDLGQVFALLADGTIRANVAARFPLAEAARALELAESRTLNGKVILVP